MTSRLDAASRVREGQEVTLWYDTSKMQVFDAKSGQNLVAKPTDEDSPEEPPSPAMSGQRDEGEARPAGAGPRQGRRRPSVGGVPAWIPCVAGAP